MENKIFNVLIIYNRLEYDLVYLFKLKQVIMIIDNGLMIIIFYYNEE